MSKKMSILDADQVLRKAYDDDTNTFDVSIGSSLVPEEHDELVLTYVAAGNGAGEVETVTYKAETVTVATLTLTYDAQNRLINVARS